MKQLPNKNIIKDEHNSTQKTINQINKTNYNVPTTEDKELLLTSQPQHSHQYRSQSPSHSQSHSQKCHHQKPNPRQSQSVNQGQYQSQRQSQHRQNSQFETKNNQRQNEDICTRCGLKHYSNTCPANGFTCDSCGIPNHFSRMCRQRNRNTNRINQINQTSYPDNDEGHAWNFSINRYVNQAANWLTKLFMPLVTIFILQSNVSFGIDTGAYENIIDEKTFCIHMVAMKSAAKYKLLVNSTPEHQ